MLKIERLKKIKKNDYLYNRLDVNLYNDYVNKYNNEEDFNKRLDLHTDFRNFVNSSLQKRLKEIETNLNNRLNND